MQHIAWKAAFVLLAVGLQKPRKKSKAKDHQECLARRLVLWKKGEIDTLSREERMIQRHLDRSRKADAPNLSEDLRDGRSNTVNFTLSERRGLWGRITMIGASHGTTRG